LCCLCHRPYLVHAITIHVLFESLLRSVGTEFLSLFCRLSRHCTARVLSDPPRRAGNRPARRWALSSTLSAERRPSSDASDGSLLHGPGVYTIFIRSSVIFTALLALAFFPEERFVIRQWKFQAGTLLG